jgi:hypothetical protein
MYSSAPSTVNVAAAALLRPPPRRGAVLLAAVGALAFSAAPVPAQINRVDRPPATCASDPGLAALFAPARPQLGRYEACTWTADIVRVAPPSWTIAPSAPLDAFGTAGPYDRFGVARLYGGRPALLARGWRRSDRGLESVTLISPYPDRALAHLVQGTLEVRFIICCT